MKPLITKHWKKTVVFLYDRLAIALSPFIAFGLRHNKIDVIFFLEVWDYYTFIIVLSFLTKLALIHVMRISSGMWRYSSIIDLRMIITMSTVSMVLTAFITFVSGKISILPRSVLLIDWITTIFLLGGARFIYRLYRERSTNRQGKKTIIIGAGQAAEKLIRDYYHDSSFNMKIIGLLDDDTTKIGRTVYSLRVLGALAELPQFIDRYGVEKVIIAIPSARSMTIRKIVDLVPSKSIEVRTLPKMSDILGGKITLSQLRPIKIEDLLGREPVVLQSQIVDETIKGRKVLVTGAGGSIGSELVRQILRFTPSEIFLIDTSELFLFNLENELALQFRSTKMSFIIGDVREEQTIKKLIEDIAPDIIYHAAAYKHVPLMEKNPLEAIKTNVQGTHNVIKHATAVKVKKFVLISTDKAVNPTSIMGASKKVAELLCHFYAQIQNETSIILVRFGNVLGSNGSVVPIFMDQIRKGGPLTITSKEMTRYFMSIPEASQLVLQASALGKNGEILVLDMGESVKIYDLAKQMIKLSGLEPHKDIEIKEVGLRPGEKLFEELFYSWEQLSQTAHPKIKTALSPRVCDHFLTLLKQELDLIFTCDKASDLQLNSLVRNHIENIIHNSIDITDKSELPSIQ